MTYYYVEYSQYSDQVEDAYEGASVAAIPAPLETRAVNEQGQPITKDTPEIKWGNMGVANNTLTADELTKNAPKIPGYLFVKVKGASGKTKINPHYYDNSMPKKPVFDQYVQYIDLVYRPVTQKPTTPDTPDNPVNPTPVNPTIKKGEALYAIKKLEIGLVQDG